MKLSPAVARPFGRGAALGAATLLPFLLWASVARGAGPAPEAIGTPLPVALDSLDQTGFTDANYEILFLPAQGGERMAIWTRLTDLDTNRNDVVGRLFDAQGQPVGARFTVNSELEGDQDHPAAAQSGARVLVAWRSVTGAEQSVHARLLDGQGQGLAPDVELAASGVDPAVGLTPSGRGLVAWATFVGGDFIVYRRMISPAGKLQGAALPVTDTPGHSKSSPAVGTDGAGRFLVVWRSYAQVGPGAGIFGRWFDPTGAPEAPEFQIHQQVIPSMGDPDVAVAADGSFVVAWDVCDFSHPQLPCEVRARAYGSAGLPRGPETRVSPPDGVRGHDSPSVALDESGDWAVSFESCRSGGVGDRYDCKLSTVFLEGDGQPLGDPLTITQDGRPLDPSIAAIGGEWLLSWDVVDCDSHRCGSEPEGTYLQRYRLVGDEQPPPPPPGVAPFVSDAIPGFRFWVRIGGAASQTTVHAEPACIPETLCVSGALPGRSELFLRIVGPKPNGYLWPTIVKFTTSEVEVWIEQPSSGDLRYYHLEGASPGSSDLPGLFDRTGFQP
jgi:hypothetical protein